MPTPLWTLPIDAVPRGMSLAREAQRLLVWTDADWLFWMNCKGERQAQIHLPNPICAAAVSEDGSAFVVAETDGRFSWRATDLHSRWDVHLKGKPTAAAVDPLGLVAAVATIQSQLLLIYSDGEVAREVTCPRPAHFLAFVPGTSTLIAAADLGWVGAFNLEIGDWIWRDAPVVSFGGLAIAGNGEPVLLACFSEGMRGYNRDGKPRQFDDPVPQCRNLALSYDASLLVTLQMDGTLHGQSLDLKPRFSHRPASPIIAMALAALGDVVWLALADRQIVALSVND
jgi:hypothetical protein